MRRNATAAGLVCLAVFGLWAGIARSEPGDREATLRRARQHFLDGRKAFEERRYPAALEEFEAGYQLEPKPGFLLDMGHAARKMGDLPRARELYQQFLAADPPEGERRAAQQLVSEIDRKLAPRAAAAAAAVPASPPGEAESLPGDEVSDDAAPAAAAQRELPRVPSKRESLSEVPLVLAPVPEPRESSDDERPSRGTWWFWAGIGVVVAGLAAIVILRARDSGDDAHTSGSWGQVKL